MWDGILNWILRRVVNMSSKEIGLDRYDNTSEVSKWTAIYEGRPHWQNLNPGKNDDYVTAELNTGATIASELARLTTIEMESEFTGGDKEEYYNEQYQRVIDNLRSNLEYALAKGGMIMRPYKDNDRVLVDFVQAGEFIPLEFDDTGKLTSVCFVDQIERGGQVYSKLEVHKLHDDGDYTIAHKVYVGNSANFNKGVEVKNLGIVEEWAGLKPEITIPAIVVGGRTLFSYFKPPFANNKNSNSNLGVSVFSKVEGLLERLDRQHSRIIYEYDSTRSLIFTDENYLEMLDDESRRRIEEDPKYVTLNVSRTGSNNDSFYNVYSPEIKDASLYRGINELKRSIELNVGLAYGTLSDVNVVAKTATEVLASKERSYSTVKDIQKALENSLRELVEAIIIIDNIDEAPGREVNVSELTESIEAHQVSFNFDDSIINDRKSKQEKLVTAIDKGYIHPKRFLMQEFGMTEEQALEELEAVKDYRNVSAKNGTL